MASPGINGRRVAHRTYAILLSQLAPTRGEVPSRNRVARITQKRRNDVLGDQNKELRQPIEPLAGEKLKHDGHPEAEAARALRVGRCYRS
jgi:hypothetical protein